MTQLDVMYRYGAAPGERSMVALAKVRDVYGVRKMEFDQRAKTVSVVKPRIPRVPSKG